MKTVGFPISHKENENRRAILPEDVYRIEQKQKIFFEKGYGNVLGIDDNEYKKTGANVVNREEVLKKDIICDPKIGDAEYLRDLKENQIIFGWIHATQNRNITDTILKSKLTAYAWEKMNYKNRHVFWKNNELAGEAAVIHAFQCYGKMPYETNVAVLGKGNTARGAIKILNMLGANAIQYDRKTEGLFKEEISQYDVVVNCVLWDLSRKDHIVSKSDLKKMKKNSMIIDVSCDKCGAIETSIPTTIERPYYYVDGILHYVVDHTPALFYKTFTKNNSEIIAPYINDLINENNNEVLNKALIIKNGIILDNEINDYQKRL